MPQPSIAIGEPLDRALLERRRLLTPPFLLHDMFDAVAADRGARPWVHTDDEEQTLTYSAAAASSWALAAALRELGFRSGDRLAVATPNHPAFLVAMLAAWRAGGAVAGLHPAYADDLLTAQIRLVAPAAVLTLDEPTLRTRVERIAAEAGGVPLLLASPRGVLTIRFGQASGDLLAERPRQASRAPPPSAPAVLQFTGGSTGAPKAATLTHAALSTNLAQFACLFPDMRYGEECFLGLPPLAHILGLNLIANCSAYLGSELVLAQRFDAHDTALLCERRGVSFFGGVPSMFAALNDSPTARSVSWRRLTYAAAGGAPVLTSIKERFESMTGCVLLQGYGLSETSPAAAFTRPTDETPEGSTGRPVPETRIEIRDTEDWNRVLERGEIGEIVIAGPQLMLGYWSNPEESAAALQGGVLHTGDLGRLDHEGRLYVVDRLKDLIISNGFNIYPARIENAVTQHPDILEAAAVAEADDRHGERVVAVVVLRAGASLTLEQLQTYLTGKLSRIEMPRRLAIVPALPKSPAGKILRRAAATLVL